jgi:predicted outer membrane protein
VEPSSDRAFTHRAELAEIVQLEAQVRRLETELSTADRARDMALELVADHEQRLAEVRALADMAEWAANIDPAPSHSEASIRVSDLRRALR